jgi:hypothetical protein
MDEKVEHVTSELRRRHFIDDGIYHYGRNSDFGLKFTKNPKELFAPYAANEPYTDAGSFQSRKYFTRHDYIIQNPHNGGLQVRGTIPRLKLSTRLN